MIVQVRPRAVDFFSSRKTSPRKRLTEPFFPAFSGSAPNWRKSCRHVRVIGTRSVNVRYVSHRYKSRPNEDRFIASRVFMTHEALLRQVWAGRRRSKANPKIVRAYVKRLRHRLGDDAARPAWIVNERGVGYRMARPGEPGEP